MGGTIARRASAVGRGVLIAARDPDATARYAAMGLNPQAAAAKRAFEIPVLIAALAVVPVIVVEEEAASFEWQALAFFANWAIWAAFAFELAVVLMRTDRRWRYVRVAWLDVLIVVVSFPLLPHLLAVSRLGRLVRLAPALLVLKAVRLAALVTRAGHSFRSLFRQHGLGYVLTISGLMALAFGALFAMVEPEADSVADGLWWAVVTVTTVGYGDIYPATLPGRLAGVALMVLGIGFVAVLTAAIAAKFIEDDVDALGIATPERIAQRLDEFQEQLDRLEAVLDDVRRRP